MKDILICRQEAAPELHEPSEQELIQWRSFGLLPVGRGGRDKSTRGASEFDIENVIRDTDHLEVTMKRQVQEWTPCYDWVPRPLAKNAKYFLVLFAGHRRFGDIPSWFEWGSDICPIPIDLAIDPHFGDILEDSLWVRLIHARLVTGCHAAPPCETFSAARWLPPPSGVKPRPLRDRDQPWGMSLRSLAEVVQFVTGNILMCKALFLVLLTHAFGGSTTLEHPKGEEKGSEKWCIWHSAFVEQLLLDKDFSRLVFLQGPLGRPFAKPTALLVGRISGLAERIFAAYDKGWRPTQVLGGKCGQHWATRAAKEYPVRLCEVLAKAHMQFAWDLQTSEIEAHAPEELSTAVNALCGHFDPYYLEAKGNVMQNDYRQRST